MATPQLTPDQITQFTRLVADYIAAQREKYAARAAPLSMRQKQAVEPFFSPEVLADTRVLVLQSETVTNPDFYPILANLGFNNLPDQSRMAAITFADVVVSHERFTPGLLFHELVHVEQYRQLGIARFSELYVHGFVSGGSYEAIPLEVNAYSLERQFESHPRQVFSVPAEVGKCLREMRL